MGNLTEDAVDLEFARKFRRLYRVAWDDLRRGEMVTRMEMRALSVYGCC